MIKTKKGFTLIELLVVIAVIGILAAAIMPTLLSVRKKAQQSNFISYVKSMQPAIVVCCDQKYSNNNVVLNSGGSLTTDLPVCFPDNGDVWSSKNVSSVSAGSCSYDGSYSVNVNAVSGKYGDCISATLTEKGVTTTGGSCAGTY